MCGYSVMIDAGVRNRIEPSAGWPFIASAARRPPAPGLFSTSVVFA